MVNSLLTSLSLPNGQVLANRFFKAAMSETMADENHNPSWQLLDLYDRWLQEDIGLIVSGNVMVDRHYLGEPGNIVLDEQSDVTMFELWAKKAKIAQKSIWLQLNHPGKQMYRSIRIQPIAPSAIPISGNQARAFEPPREMTIVEIQETIEKFVKAASLAEKAGFTGVELHAAHGYLINQFLSSADNKRQDAYGGSLNGRLRFLREIIQGIRSVTQANFGLALKLNATDFKPDGFSFEECQIVVRELSDSGLDLIEISGGNYESPIFGEEGTGAKFLNYATVLAKQTHLPVVSTGGFRDSQEMEMALESGVAMIGLARPFILRPNLVSYYKEKGQLQIETPRLTTGIKLLDQQMGAIIGVSYYEGQMRQLAKGKSAQWRRNAWPYLLNTFKEHGLSALKPRRF